MKRYCRGETIRLAIAGLGIPMVLAFGANPVWAAQASEPQSLTYQCESGNSIIVYPDDSDPAAPTVRLEYLGRAFDLYQVASSPGRFATEAGLQPDHGLQWSSDGDKATLSEMLMDHTAPGPTAIETCTRNAATALTAEGAIADTTLPLGAWRLVTLHGAAAAEDVKTTISFDPDGRVSGNGGCNTFGGQATLTPTGIVIPDVFSTMMACGDDSNQQEHAFLGVLERTASHHATSGELFFYDKAGELLASFVLAAVPNDLTATGEPEYPPPLAPDGTILFRNVRIFNGVSAELSVPSDVLIEGNLIARISTQPIDATGADVKIIEGGGRVLMPGLIDAHWHAFMAATPQALLTVAEPAYLQLLAAHEAEATLMRGFTTIRDLGGPVFGLKRAIDQGIAIGPRIYPSGAMISQTSGHGDFRFLYELPRIPGGPLSYSEAEGISAIADSPDEVRLRAREQLRFGASQIKLMAGGGVNSPAHNPIESIQYTEAEMRAAVEAAENWGTYVTVHAYTPASVQRAIRAGVKVIDHGQLLDDETVQLMAEKGIWWSLQPFEYEAGVFARLSPSSQQRALQVFSGTDNAYRLAKKYHVKTAFGADILFDAEAASHQGAALTRLTRWYTPAEALKMATADNGELMALSGFINPYPGRLGVVEEGALADLLLVDGDPLENIKLIEDPQRNLLVIMKDGHVFKNILDK